MNEETELSRRSFMGVFGGVTAAGLIVKATSQELQAFASPLAMDAPLALAVPPAIPKRGLNQGEFVFNSHGEIIGVIEDITISRESIEDTALGDHRRHFRAGKMQMTIQVSGLCTMTPVGPSGFELRGRKP